MSTRGRCGDARLPRRLLPGDDSCRQSTRRTTRPRRTAAGVKTSQTIVRWLAGAYFIVLGYLLIAPHPLWLFGESGGQAEEAIDATLSGFLQHVLAYAVLACLLLLSAAPITRERITFCVLAAVAHGTVFEALQRFVPDRYLDWPDALGNLTGVGLGALLTICGLYSINSLHKSQVAHGTSQRGKG